MSDTAEILDGLKRLKDAETAAGNTGNRALEQAIKHYEKMEQESRISRVQAVLWIAVTGKDIDDIVALAIEGASGNWCYDAKAGGIDGELLGKYVSEQISRGGDLILLDAEGDYQLLTKEKLLQGIRMYAEKPTGNDIFEVVNHELHIDCGMVDAKAADAILQYAIYSTIIYG